MTAAPYPRDDLLGGPEVRFHPTCRVGILLGVAVVEQQEDGRRSVARVRQKEEHFEAVAAPFVAADDRHALERRRSIHRRRILLDYVETQFLWLPRRAPEHLRAEQFQDLRPPLAPLPGRRDDPAVREAQRIGQHVRLDLRLIDHSVRPALLQPLDNHGLRGPTLARLVGNGRRTDTEENAEE